jgi:hypothetical protein
VNYKHRFNHKDQGGFPMPCKEGHLKQTLNLPLSMIKFISDFGWCINTPSHYKDTGVLLTQFPERKETVLRFHHEFNGCDGRELRMDQQRCSYSTILNDIEKEACTE